MLLLHKVEGAPIIDIDPLTGEWRNANQNEAPEGKPACELPIGGSYIDIENKRYFKYWNDLDETKPDTKFYFRTSDGLVIEIDGLRYASCVPATDSAGNPQPDYNQCTIYEADGTVLFSIVYEAAFYRHLHQRYLQTFHWDNDDNTIESWDFFASMPGSFNYMKEQRLAREAALVANPPVKARTPTPSAEPSSICTLAGTWYAIHDRMREITLKVGDTFPAQKDGPTGGITWYWKHA
jgi:hypothetical protein